MSSDKEALICEKLVDMMEDKSFFDINVKEFTQFAGIGRSTFYWHFESLYDVLQKVENDFIDGLLPEQQVAQTARVGKPEALTAALASKVAYIERNKRLLRILVSENGDPSFAARIINRNKRIVRGSLEQNRTVNHAKIEVMAEYISAGQFQALTWWVTHDSEMDLLDLLLTLERNVIALNNSLKER